MHTKASEPFAGFFDMVEALGRAAQYDHSVSIPQLGSVFRYNPASPLGTDQRLIAEVYNVSFAWPSTNGTTALNVMALITLARPGDKVLYQRDSHVSVFAPMIHLGLQPIYIQPTFDSQLGISLGITADQIRQQLDLHPDIRAVFLTYPNYFGIATDIQNCAELLRERRVPLIIDSAHGSHFHFHPQLPLSAEATGASIVTQSTHKTCIALSQGSLALFNDLSIVERFYEVVNHLGFVSTSFSYVILQSIILSVLQLHSQGETLLGTALEVSDSVRRQINTFDGLWSFGQELAGTRPGFKALDPLRVTVDVSQLGVTGFQFEEQLIEQFNVYPEMATLQHVLFLFTLADNQQAGEQVVEAVQEVAARTQRRQPIVSTTSPCIPPQIYLPRDVFFEQKRRRLPVAEAVGLPSAETIATYPPGSAIIMAGEEITGEIVEFLQRSQSYGGVLKGASDPSFSTVLVMDR